HTRFSRDWSSDVCSSDLTDVLLTNYFVIDFETTNLEKGSARNLDNSIVLCSIRDNGRVHSEFTNEYNIHRACSLAESKLLVAHRSEERRVGKECSSRWWR